MNNVSSESHDELALFLDVDGTLLQLAPTPDAVDVPPYLPELLSRLSRQLDGALALVSGRQLHEIDRLFSPYRFCGAGAHGCELRAPGIAEATAMVDTQLIATIHRRCRALQSISAGVLVEYKTFGAAIHYRLAPDAEPMVAAKAAQLLREVGAGFEVQPGKYVYEIKPAGFTKGTAITALMSSAPFAARRPVFIGDDATDEHGFDTVNRAGGISIKVGMQGASIAIRRVATPADVLHLLAHLHDAGMHALTGAPDWLESLFADRITRP